MLKVSHTRTQRGVSLKHVPKSRNICSKSRNICSKSRNICSKSRNIYNICTPCTTREFETYQSVRYKSAESPIWSKCCAKSAHSWPRSTSNTRHLDHEYVRWLRCVSKSAMFEKMDTWMKWVKSICVQTRYVYLDTFLFYL